MKLNIMLLILSFSVGAQADITPAYRQANAVVLYDFAEDSGQVIDKSTFGAPLNLDIYAAPNMAVSPPERVPGRLTLSSANVVRSAAKATKLINACKASGALSVEVWLRNNESVLLRSALDAKKRDQPLRIVNLSQSLSQRNFTLGQFYDMGNFYEGAVRTSSNEPNAAAEGNSLVEPLSSSVSAIMVPDTTIGRTLAPPQKVVFTLNPTGVARLYLSDMNGYMYLAQTATTGFGSAAPGTYLANWFDNAFLTLGNDNMTPTEFNSEVQLRSDFANCGSACFANKNRYWKGDLNLVAVYCNEVPRDQVLGAGSQNVIKNTLPPPNGNINPVINADTLKAQEIFNRITGAKISVDDSRITTMAQMIRDGATREIGLYDAAGEATKDPRFLNTTVRDFAAKMSNRAETINIPLNDFTATVIGFVKDNLNAQGLLTTDQFYMATNPSEAPVGSSIVEDILRSNNHYAALDLGRYDLSLVLHSAKQQVLDTRGGTIKAVDNPSPAGLLTTRQWMQEHAVAGTNRRMIEFAFREFLCSPIETVADNSGPDNVVGRDVDRFPGGSYTKFTTTCKACHTIMDGFRPAFSRWTFSNGFAKHSFVVPSVTNLNTDENTSMGMLQDASVPNITQKLNKNETVFPAGRVTTDEKWINNAVYGSNKSTFDFKKLSGSGPNDFGAMLVGSPKFSRCMANRVFVQLCKREVDPADNDFLNAAAKDFSDGKYNLRNLFKKIVSGSNCLGGGQ